MNLGPYEPNNIYCGECADMMSKLPDGCIDLTVTSPPYDNLRSYNGYTFDFFAIARQLIRVTKPGGVIVWVVADQTVNGSETGTSFKQALYFMAKGMRLHDTMVYQVKGTGAKGSNYAYWQSFEYMFVFSKGKPKSINLIRDKVNVKAGSRTTVGKKQRATGTRLMPENGVVISDYGYRENIWTYHSGNNGRDITSHPAPFPELLARDHILSWSNKGDLCLDPFCGSGTVPKMCIETGRNFLGFDISSEYVDLSKRRIQRARIPLPLEL